MSKLNKNIEALLQQYPEIARALEEVDRTTIRAALKRSTLERLEAATAHLKGLRRFKRAASETS